MKIKEFFKTYKFKERGLKLINNVFKYGALLLAGFIGGCLAPMFLSLFQEHPPKTLDQAVAIANTYIVFTTIFFVGITVLLALGGYILSQQLATTRKHLENQAHEDLMKRIRFSESIATDIVKNLSANGDFKNQITQNIKEYTNQILNEAAHESDTKVIAEKTKSDKISGIKESLANIKEGL